MTLDSGILYIATGPKYIDEAFRSAKISKSFALGYSLSLVTDSPSYALKLNNDSNIFDQIILHSCPNYSYRDKIAPLTDLPYSNCLFLDSDAFLVESFTYFLDFCSYFDLSGCFSPVRHPPGWICNSAPSAFPEVNTGVLFMKRSDNLTNLMHAWLHLYDKINFQYKQSWDQATFRSVLWNNIVSGNIRYNTLPEEFNIRTTKPWMIGRGSPAYVVHGRFPDGELNAFLDYINGNHDTFRTWSLWMADNPNSSIQPRYDKTFG